MSTPTLDSLLDVPDKSRDLNWEVSFLDIFPNARVRLINDIPQSGPDNFPYLLLESNSLANKPALSIINWASQKGVGIVLNPQKEYPDYIFTFGQLWYFTTTGKFTNPASSSEFNLPPHIRMLIRQFLNDQGVMKPRLAIMTTDNRNYDLCFSLESLGSPPADEYQGILKALSWFVPGHYSLAMAEETRLNQFIDL